MVANDLITTAVERRGGITVLAVAGDIDMATAPVLKAAILDILADGPLALVIDLSAVQFLGSAGLPVLVTARQKVGSAAHFAVVARGPAINRVIRLVDLDEFLSLQETLDDALTAVSAITPGYR